MAQSFKETAHLKTDKKAFDEGWDNIKKNPTEPFKLKKVTYVVRNGEVVELDEEEAVKTKKHVTAGLCGEFGMSTFNEEAYKENFDRINWGKNANTSGCAEEVLCEVKNESAEV